MRNLIVVDHFYISGRGDTFTLSMRENGLDPGDLKLKEEITIDRRRLPDDYPGIWRISGIEMSMGWQPLDMIGIVVHKVVENGLERNGGGSGTQTGSYAG